MFFAMLVSNMYEPSSSDSSRSLDPTKHLKDLAFLPLFCPHHFVSPLQLSRLAIPGAAGDRELDVWMYQHHCEVQKIPCGPLLPDQMPDRITVLQLLRFALNRAQTPESEALIPLCVDVLKQNVLTEPLLRAMSSDAVYHEYSMLSIDQKAPLLCTLASMRSFRTQKIRLASEPLIATLQSLLDFLGSPDGAFLRSRGILAAADFAVPYLKFAPKPNWHNLAQLGNSIQKHPKVPIKNCINALL